MTSVDEILDELVVEQAALDAIVAPLAPADWAKPTPSPGWSIADQIGHLWYFDETAALAISDAAGFAASTNAMMQAVGAAAGPDDVTLGAARSMTPDALLEAWRAGRASLQAAGRAADATVRVPWYGPDMSMKSFLTARLMEAWAHGQDVVDAVGATRPATDRLRHIAQLGFITRGWTYINRSSDIPATPVRVVLTAPGGGTWLYGDHDASESIVGSAEDFCLVVTQRRNVADTGLVVVGESAADWMSKAQVFAGGVTDPPAAGAFGGVS
jgi:uncharacterized protein (TIGR03084 family)